MSPAMCSLSTTDILQLFSYIKISSSNYKADVYKYIRSLGNHPADNLIPVNIIAH